MKISMFREGFVLEVRGWNHLIFVHFESLEALNLCHEWLGGILQSHSCVYYHDIEPLVIGSRGITKIEILNLLQSVPHLESVERYEMVTRMEYIASVGGKKIKTLSTYTRVNISADGDIIEVFLECDKMALSFIKELKKKIKESEPNGVNIDLPLGAIARVNGRREYFRKKYVSQIYSISMSHCDIW